MKNCTLLILIVFLSAPSFAQDSSEQQDNSKRQEIGLIMSDFDNFGITYRLGHEKSLWRFSTVLINGGSNETEFNDLLYTSNAFGFRFEVGKEFRKPIIDKLDFRYGVDLVTGFSRNKTLDEDLNNPGSEQETIRNRFDVGINMVLGLNYLIGDNFIFGVELLPGVIYSKTKEKDDGITDLESSSFNYGFSSNAGRLSFMFKF